MLDWILPGQEKCSERHSWTIDKIKICKRLEKSINVKLTEVDNYCDYIIKYPFSYKIHTEVSRGKEL